MYNPGQNSLAKCILFSYFPSHAHMSTLCKIFGTLFPPPTSMLLLLIKSLGKKNSFATNNIDIGGRRIELHLLPHILSMIVAEINVDNINVPLTRSCYIVIHHYQKFGTRWRPSMLHYSKWRRIFVRKEFEVL